MAEKEYYRLTWFRRRPGIALITVARASLWLGKDHVLCIETNGYTESYKRFYFRDIQAFALSRTSSQTGFSIFFGILGAVLLAIGLISRELSVIVTFSIFAVTFGLVPLVINLAMGPTCKCQIRTAVQTEDLPIHRVRKMRKVLERLQPLIAAAQGQLTPEEIAARMQSLVSSLPSKPPPAAMPGTSIPAVEEQNLPPSVAS